MKKYTHNSFGCFDTSSALLRGSSFSELKNNDNFSNLLEEINLEVNSNSFEDLKDASLEFISGKMLYLLNNMKKSLIISAATSSNQVLSYLSLFVQFIEFSNQFEYEKGNKTIQLIKNASFTETQILSDFNKERVKKRIESWLMWFYRIFKKQKMNELSSWKNQRSMIHWIDDKRWFEVIIQKN